MPEKVSGIQKKEGNDLAEPYSPTDGDDMPSWTLLLEETRQNNHKYSSFPQIQLFMRQFYNQITSYGRAVREKERDPSSTCLTRDLILQTRSSLRFATVCLSKEETRSALQNEAIITNQWHLPLCNVLAQKKGDDKCRILMARLLCNLVTNNSDTATALACAIPLSPTDEQVETRIRSLLVPTDIDDELVSTAVNTMQQSTWVDMMLACATQAANREALAALVAALYNCMLSVPPSNTFCGQDFFTKIASNRLLMSTLLRQMLPASSVTALYATDNDDCNDDHSPADEATEWIVRTIEKQCRLGQLPAMYTSAAGGEGVVTPELIVLLHCVASAVQQECRPNRTNEKPFLGRDVGDIAIVSSHVALAHKFCALNSVLMEAKEGHYTKDENQHEPSDNAFSSDPVLTQEAWLLILEILASSLGTNEHESMTETRLAIGRDTHLVQDVALDLGTIVDSLSATNQGRNARELVVSDVEQRRIIGLVQFLGNVCYRCRQNQNLMRHTLVPFPPLPSFGTTVCGSCMERTALHVLLSCTSFSYGCFTLREWAIVALRNVLEANEANQVLVEQLEAQQPKQSAELEGMGLRVDMDPDGKVRVVPTEEADAKGDSSEADER